MADDKNQLDYPVHYFKQVSEYDSVTGQLVTKDPGPWCETPEQGILTKNQGRVDCLKCIRWAGLKENR